jgi:ATP phosphoribosyltransferase regulatory subunit HisZ
LRSAQISERISIEEAHMLQFQQFNKEWDKKMSDYENKSEELVEAMKERHLSELKAFQAKVQQKQSRPKFSKELLNLRKIQDTLARNKE